MTVLLLSKNIENILYFEPHSFRGCLYRMTDSTILLNRAKEDIKQTNFVLIQNILSLSRGETLLMNLHKH